MPAHREEERRSTDARRQLEVTIEREELEEIAVRGVSLRWRATCPGRLEHRVPSDLGPERVSLVRARRIRGNAAQHTMHERLGGWRVGILHQHREGLRLRGNAAPAQRRLVATPIRRVPRRNRLAVSEALAGEANVTGRLERKTAVGEALLARALARNAPHDEVRQAPQQRSKDVLGVLELHGAEA